VPTPIVIDNRCRHRSASNGLRKRTSALATSRPSVAPTTCWRGGG